MKTTTKQVVRMLLEHYRNHLHLRKHQEINLNFHDYFTKSELLDIVSFVLGTVTKEQYNLEAMDCRELLELIHDDKYLVDYVLHSWEQEELEATALSHASVLATLEQLGLHTHYLCYKPLGTWNAYDHANYQSLLKKAGKLVGVYGIYDTSVSQEQVATVSSTPKRYFDTHTLALEALEQTDIADAHILKVCVAK